MGTHSSIGIKTSNGKVMFVDCHYSGFIKGVGRVLFEHYRNLDKVIDLLMDGDIESLGITPNTTKRESEEAGWHKEPRVARDVEEWQRIGDGEYFYLFNRGKWRVIYSEWVSKEDGGSELKEVNALLTNGMFEEVA